MPKRTYARLGLVAATVVLVSLMPAAPPFGFSVASRNSYDALDDSPVPKSADNGRRADLFGRRSALPGDERKPPRERSEPVVRPADSGRKSLGIPARLLQAYQGTAIRLRFADPGCGLDWPILAGIGKVESNHAWDGRIDERGTTLRPILGPVLDGKRYAPVPDTDGGRLDGDGRWDRAVGPMQFIPSSWARFAADGNSDGTMSPHNVYDAAYAAAMYLCVGEVDLSEPDQLSRAVHRYNHSAPYVQAVTAWIEAYRSGGAQPRQGSTDPVLASEDGSPTPAPGRPQPPPDPGPVPSPTNPGPRPEPSPTPSPSPSSPAPTPTPTTTPGPTATPTPTPGPWCLLDPLPIPLPPVCL